MTDEEISLEHEYEVMGTGEALKTCPRCKATTYGKSCRWCITDGHPLPLSGDAFMDNMISRMEADEDIDLNEIFKPGQKEEFVPVELTDARN